MNNKTKFYDWLKKEKNYSPKDFKFKRMEFESLARRYPFFDMSDIEEVANLSINAERNLIDIYLEFLAFMNKKNKDDVLESQETTGDKKRKKTIPTIKEITVDKTLDVVIDEESKQKEYGFLDFKNECEKAESTVLKKNNLTKHMNIVVNEKQQLVFDVVTGRFYDLNNSVNFEPMATYAFYEDEEGVLNRFKRKDNVFYYDSNCITKQVSVANAYTLEGDVIKTSLDDSYEELSKQHQNVDEKLICIVPDTTGDFNDRIKRQIKSSNHKFVQVPRSVAAVYSRVDLDKTKTEKEFTVYDFDAEKLTKTIIRVEFDAENEVFNIVRYGRRTFSSNSIVGFRSLARLYIEEYARRNHIILDEKIINNLINTRDIYNVICEKQNILVKNKDTFVSIKYDENIMFILFDSIKTCVEESGEDNPLILFGTHSLINGFVTVDDLSVGYKRILKRIINKKIICKEYLPELSLEVIRNGTFDSLQLISKNNVQNITEASMDEEVDIPIENGRFVFMPGRDKIYCPLTREEFGNMQRDKLAMFYAPKIFPLKDVVEVELSLKYRYGDPDSYRLIATPTNGEFKEISSQWCDESEQIMGNERIPEYTPQRLSIKEIDVNKIIEEAFSKTEKRWFYSSTIYNDGPPFDNKNNWFALNSISYNLIAIRNFFSIESAENIDDYTMSNVIRLLEKLDELYRNAEDEYLYDGECDFGSFHFRCIKYNILNIASMLGMFLVDEIGLDYNTRSSIINSILESKEPRYLFQLSAYITRNNDKFCVWNHIDELLSKLKGRKLLDAIRAVSTVCWRNKDWIYEFSAIDRSIMQSIIDTSFSFCHSEIENISHNYNPRTIRDILEALLGITRLKKDNITVLDIMNCNSKKVKEFIADLKKINELMSVNKLKFPFVSRIEMEVPDNMKNVSSVVYPLIEILSDGNAVKLTGFTEADD